MINASSLAAATAVSIKNTVFKGTATTVPRKILVLGSFDPSRTEVKENRPHLVSSSEESALLYGPGSMLDVALRGALAGAENAVPVYAFPQKEATNAVASKGSLTFSDVGEEGGEATVQIGGTPLKLRLSSGDTGGTVANFVKDLINEHAHLPVTAVVGPPSGTPPAGPNSKVALTAKSGGSFGDHIALSTAMPSGASCTVEQMAGGSGIPDISGALLELGSGDEANTEFFTDVVNAYGLEKEVLKALSLYNGVGNASVGCYGEMVHRPFRVLCGETSVDLATLISTLDDHTDDRTNGVVCVPGSKTHPAQIAGQAMGIMSRISNERPEQNYVDEVLYGVDLGAASSRWTKNYAARDRAVKGGLSPTRVKGSRVVLQNVVSFYRPPTVPVSSNGYRSMRNIAIIQNLLFNLYRAFEQEKWKGISIVKDVQQVSDLTHRRKTRDIDAVKDDLVSLAGAFAGKAWIYSPEFTINELKKQDAVQIRIGGDGFESQFKVVLSGEGLILSSEILFDTSIAVFL